MSFFLLLDISFYYNEYTSKGEECDDNGSNFHCNHSRLIAQSYVMESRLVDTRLSSDESILFQDSLYDDRVAMLAIALQEQQDERCTNASEAERTSYHTFFN